LCCGGGTGGAEALLVSIDGAARMDTYRDSRVEHP
jgi:hypothetical protein